MRYDAWEIPLVGGFRGDTKYPGFYGGILSETKIGIEAPKLTCRKVHGFRLQPQGFE